MSDEQIKVYWCAGRKVALRLIRGAREMTIELDEATALELSKEIVVAVRTTGANLDQPAQHELTLPGHQDDEPAPRAVNHRNASQARLDAYMADGKAHTWAELSREFGPDVDGMVESLRRGPYNRPVTVSEDGARVGLAVANG